MALATAADCFRLRKSDLGWCGACWSERGLAAFVIGRETPQDAAAALERTCGDHQLIEPGQPETRLLDRLLQVIQDGRDDSLWEVALDTAGYTPFQMRVVDACRRIPRGEIRTYGELADQAGSPRAARAVGTVMSRNRFPLIVPCHRVVAAGSLGGFSAPTGQQLKRELLRREGRRMD